MSKQKKKIVDSTLSLLGILGTGIMGYLVYLHYSTGESAFCDISTELQCSVVNQSIYSELFGIPVALLGLLYFLPVIAFPFLKKRVDHIYNLIAAFTLFSLCFSFYLSYLELFVLQTICLFCEAAKVVMLLILALCLWSIKKGKEEFLSRWHVGAVLLGIMFTVFAYFMQTAPETNRDYTPLAQCLTEKNVVMYGAFWCPKCARQKKNFGDAFQHVQEVECDPRGENAQPELCLEKNIAGTPTWLQEENGTELKRLEGFIPLEQLAEEFNCPLAAETT